MTAAISTFRAGPAVMFGALLLLTACAQPELILTGQREAIHPTLEDADFENRSLPIRLAPQSANPDWQQFFGTQTLRNTHPALPTTPTLAWSAEIGAGNSRKQRITAEPVVAGGLVYTLDSSTTVSAVTTGGQPVWSVDAIPPGDTQGEATGGGLAYAKGRLYVSLGFGELVALDAKTGAVIWRQKLGATGSGDPTVVDGLVYLVAGDDTGWAIDAENGRIAWQVVATSSVANILGAPAPAVTGKLAVFAFGSGEIVAAFRRGGLRRWDTSVSGQRPGRAISRISDVTGAPVVVGNRIYVGNHSGRLAAIDAQSGERIWTALQGTEGPVWPAGDSVFAITDKLKLARFNAATGDKVWEVDLPGFVKDKPRRRGAVFAHYGPILAGGQLIVASNDGFLRFFSPEDGSLLYRAEVPGGAASAPVVAGKTLYVLGAKGKLYAFR